MKTEKKIIEGFFGRGSLFYNKGELTEEDLKRIQEKGLDKTVEHLLKGDDCPAEEGCLIWNPDKKMNLLLSFGNLYGGYYYFHVSIAPGEIKLVKIVGNPFTYFTDDIETALIEINCINHELIPLLEERLNIKIVDKSKRYM